MAATSQSNQLFSLLVISIHQDNQLLVPDHLSFIFSCIFVIKPLQSSPTFNGCCCCSGCKTSQSRPSSPSIQLLSSPDWPPSFTVHLRLTHEQHQLLLDRDQLHSTIFIVFRQQNQLQKCSPATPIHPFLFRSKSGCNHLASAPSNHHSSRPSWLPSQNRAP